MVAERLQIDVKADREKAAAMMRQGHLVVFPTDTVYGIGGAVHSQRTIASLYDTKMRPLEKGLPVLLAGPDDIWQVAAHLSPLAQDLAAQHWPGPLTLIVAKRPDLPDNLTPNDGVAVRVPDHAGCQELIRLAGGAIASSSANIASEPPAVRAEEAELAIGDNVAAILDGGTAQHQVPSTIIDCRTSTPQIIRQGPLKLQFKELAKLK